jgi:hypothetical protein
MARSAQDVRAGQPREAAADHHDIVFVGGIFQKISRHGKAVFSG